MPLIRVKPKVETETAQVFEFEGRTFAIVQVDPDVGVEALENAQQVISDFLGMDVLMVNCECDIELVEAPPPTWHERVASE